ncbi:hypothetical protein [Streptomyces sp. 8L]|uniref:hypothetical protein n=1 Tax=Streptomyces sp. 8L TaxID=2877242 RepID=UPI001CD37E97|nr:hypothetical protein [Streptomyces sp. 8L]MCA1222052.1 hypothetical protein [Streptomyces sp. 8L]
MRASRVLAVTATACAAMAFSAPLAGATSGPLNVQATPYTVHQGGTIRITVDGCGSGGLVTSNAFPKTRLSQSPSGHASATARIFDKATPGTYNLAVRCNGGNRVATRQFSVVAGRGALGGLGGSVGPSSAETAVGAGFVATAAIGGTAFVVRRRRTPGAV